mmetsp:Transcript_15541/g.21009  ORF Transcript_15541/g.21009 Transcript_15541/m.21009 type:complete len:216 (-) Transcript_15541:40-687(-)
MLRVHHAPRHDLHWLRSSCLGRCVPGLSLTPPGRFRRVLRRRSRGPGGRLVRLLQREQSRGGVVPLVGAELGESVREAALVTVMALALLVPDAQRLLVEHVGGAQLLLAVGEGAVRILAAGTLHERHTEPRLAKVRGSLQLRAGVSECAVSTVLASALEVVHAELGLVQLVVQAGAPGLLVLSRVLRRCRSVVVLGSRCARTLVDAHDCSSSTRR